MTPDAPVWACGDCGTSGTGTAVPRSCPKCGAPAVTRAPSPPVPGVARWRATQADVDAIQFTGANTAEVTAFLGGPYAGSHHWAGQSSSGGTLTTTAGETAFWPGDWLIRGADGVFDVRCDAAFRAAYRRADASSA